MKKVLLFVAVALLGAATAQAQEAQALAVNKLSDNWSIGVAGGVTTPMKHASFWNEMRGQVAVNINKQITPIFGIGVEGAWGINTSSWTGERSSTMFDSQYVGAYGATNLNNLFGGYKCGGRFFEVELVAGAGWGHEFVNGEGDWNYFATKAGLNFNFNVAKSIAINVKPSVVWNMSDADVAQTSAAYNANNAAINIMAGVTFKLGNNGFECVRPYDQAEVDALNGQINALRGELAAANAALNGCNAEKAQLANELEACKNRKPEVIVKEDNSLNTVRYVFFNIGRTNISKDQMPNVEQVASYLKNHPNAKVVVKGYASQDGPEDVNIRLANERAQSVKDTLVKKYKISADRIAAEGQGIGKMFSEESWNRVSICTIEE